MRAAKRQKAPLILDGLNATARSAAKKAAREAGMSLDDWVAATVADRTKLAKKPLQPKGAPDELDAAVAKLKTATRRPAKPPASPKPTGPEAELEKILAAAAADHERRARKQAETTAVAFDSVAAWIERAEDRLIESSRAAAEGHERTAHLLSEALAGMTRRLDDIESKVADGGQPSMEAALKAVERIESQLGRAGQEREQASGDQIEAVLRGFEERIAGISDRLNQNAPRPIGRRGLESQIEVRSAVDEIRARQAELDEGGGDGPAAGRSNDAVLSSLRGDIARLAGRLDTIRPADAVEPAVAAILGEIELLQGAVSGLATRDEVNAIERSMRSLVAQIASASAPAEVAAVAATVSALRGEIRRLSENVQSGLQGRLARDLDVLASKVEVVAGSGVDPAVVDPLGERLVDIRRIVAEMADPHHVQVLEGQIVALNDRLADLGRQRDEFGDLGERIDALSRKLDRLGEEPPRGGPEALRASIESAPLLTTLVQRLDRLDEIMRRPAPAPELKPIEELLQILVERIDQVERPGADYGALDALEHQVATLAERIERSTGGDPALVALERAMGHLMTQVEAIRDGAFEAAERAAVKDTLAVLPQGEEPAEFGLLKRDLQDLRANHSASDQRTRATLESVGAALEKVVARLGNLEQESIPEKHAIRAPEGSPQPRRPLPILLGDPGSREQAAAKAQANNAAPNPLLKEADRPIPPAGREEVLLEPGAARPRPDDAPFSGHPSAALIPADIKASFIAAARRAAQAAAAEAAANGVKRTKTKRGAEGTPTTTPGGSSLAARMVQGLDKRRRPILLGLAAIVLTLGAVQTIGVPEMSDATTALTPTSTPTDAPVAVASNEAQRGALALDPAEPRTTQALPNPKPAETTPSSTESKPAETSPASSPAPVAAQSRDREVTTVAALPSPEEAKPGPSAATTAARVEPRTPPAPVVPGRDEAKPPSSPVVPVKIEAKTPTFVAAASPQAAPVQAPPTVPSARAADQRLSSEPRAPFERIANAALGDIPAQIGVPGLRQAALSGDPSAVYDLAARAAEGRGLSRDLKLAARLFETAATHGLVPAQYRIGNHYEKGLGVTRDLALAKTWYQRAAEKGNARAMHNLAVIMAEGSGGKPDYIGAAEWFRRAADLGVRDSQFNLAVLFGRGLGVTQDLVTSHTWFSIAAARGDDDAGKKRDEVGARLTATELASARKAAEAWKLEIPNRTTNEVTLPAGGWSEAPAPATTNVKGPSAGQPAAMTTNIKGPSTVPSAGQPAATNIKGPLPGKGV